MSTIRNDKLQHFTSVILLTILLTRAIHIVYLLYNLSRHNNTYIPVVSMRDRPSTYVFIGRVGDVCMRRTFSTIIIFFSKIRVLIYLHTIVRHRMWTFAYF